MNPLISIVVPIYNVSQYLTECLDSLLEQTYKRFEVLLIDDGSTDNSGQICDHYSQIDSRFRVFHIKNSGLSAARNFALQHAVGEYIAFVDGDDKCLPNHFELLVKTAIKCESDIVMAGLVPWSKQDIFSRHFADIKTQVIPTSQCFKLVFSLRPWDKTCLRGGYAVTKLFSKKSVDGIKFDTTKDISEDELFVCMALLRAEKVVILNQANYFYRLRKSSITNSSFFGYKLLHTRLKIAEIYDQQHVSLYKDILNASICLGIWESLSQWHRSEAYPKGEREIIMKVNEKFLPEALDLVRKRLIKPHVYFVMRLLKSSTLLLGLLIGLYQACRIWKNEQKHYYFE